MFSNPNQTEINHHTIKLIIGVIALSLAALTSYLSEPPLIQSISASYHRGGWSRDIFVGFLFAISAFLLAYNGRSAWEFILSKISAFAAMGVALFPCKCECYIEIIPNVHGISAAVMFISLAGFCFIFFFRAYKKGHHQAMFRAYLYALCGSVIIFSILIIALDNILDGIISDKINRLTFYGEAAGLISFGIAWLTASRTLPLITRKEERRTLSPFRNHESN